MAAASPVDLLIVGAGPVGLALGIEARRHGLSCRVVEKLTERSPYSRAFVIWPATQEAFDAMGVADAIEAQAHRVTHAKLHLGGKPTGQVDFLEDLKIETGQPCPLMLPQSETERILEERLRGLGGEVERGAELTGFTQNLEGVKAEVRQSDGTTARISARWLAGCDGAHSVVRHTLGIGFEGEALSTTFLLADVALEGPLDRDSVHFFTQGSDVGGFIPFGEATWRVITNRQQNDPRTEPPALEEIQDAIVALGLDDLSVSNPSWLSAFRIQERRAERFHLGRTFLLGDACHVHSPAGGQGMNTGIQDAFNLGWKLGLICQGASDWRSLVDSYEAERIPVAEHVLSLTSRATALMTEASPVKRFFRDQAARAALRTKRFRSQLAAQLAELDIEYEESPLFERFAHWHEDFRQLGFPAGTRMRDALVFERGQSSPKSLLALSNTPGHTLLVFEGLRRQRHRQAVLEDLMKAVPSEVDVSRLQLLGISRNPEPPDIDPRIRWLHDPDGSAHQRFAAYYASWYIIRPDNVVAVRAMPAEGEPLTDYATRFLI